MPSDIGRLIVEGEESDKGVMPPVEPRRRVRTKDLLVYGSDKQLEGKVFGEDEDTVREHFDEE